MLQGKKKGKTTEEEGDGSYCRLLREATLSEERKEGDDNVAVVAYFTTLQRSSTTESPSSAAL
jgi:hypothetical protein